MAPNSLSPQQFNPNSIFKRQQWNHQRQPRSPLPPVTDTNTLLQLIEEGKQDEFGKAKKSIENTGWLRLAGAIVKKYPAHDIEELPRTNSLDVNGRPPAELVQTQKQWLDLLLNTLPNQTIPRNLADELISEMGQHRDQEGLMSEQHQDQARILQFILDNTPSLLTDRNSLNQTIVHVAASNGAYLALLACVWVLLAVCECQDESTHKPDCKDLSAMLRAVDNKNYTPLHYAVLHGKAAAVVYILDQYHEQEPAETIRRLLQIAISCKHETSEEIIRELLLSREGTGSDQRHAREEADESPEKDTSRTYRKDIVQEDTLRHAVEHFQPRVFELLLDLSDTNLDTGNCNLLHFAVSKARDEAAIMLLERHSKLAIQLQPAEPFSELAASSTGEDRRLPVFSCLRPSDTDSNIRRRILEALMEQLPISQLREHLRGPSWLGKEISLDITNLAFDPSLLTFFVYFVQKDLTRAEHLAAIAGSPSSSRVTTIDLTIRTTTESQQTQRQAQRLPPSLSQQHRHRHRPPGATVVSRSGVDFEHALKYVNIPSFETGTPERRTEALSIFRWLRKCKGVERVFQVQVDDCRHYPHSEEDIEDALTGLDVRELDWQRVDLSAISVYEAAPRVEKLWLYSSGNMAVLDHWFGEKGIRTLHNLRNVYIKIIQDTFLGEPRAQHCKAFCSRAPRPEGVELDVSITTQWGVNMGSSTHSGLAGSARKLRPVEVTNLKEFLEFYRMVPGWLKDQYPDIQDWRIKVGVVDTGISTARFSIDSHVVHGRSFVWTNTAKEFEQETSWWLATDSHGSQMANIISQLDPRCIFYMAQVTDDARYFNEGNVVKAFEWLISEGVQIINCSFALRHPSTALRDVVRKARSRGIVIMCSTSDEGENTDEVWPAAYYTQQEGAVERFDNVFPIVGCDEHGKPSRFSSEAAGRYYFRGEDIDASGTDLELLTEPGVVRGSSVATAMATGIASLLLACYRMLLALREPKAPDAASAPGIVNVIFHKMLQPTTIGPGLPESVVKRHRLVTASRFFLVDDIRDEEDFIGRIEALYDDVLRAYSD
ncbi:putative subtilisin like [Rosellinia necatrix]|uniref:Putative subtilisin like n=1 Tax=Rosellinia necatrix TaxID=77044 RepID=A0A1S7UKC7_ROSNE|nr:putative subtilisin like [Rosellinia necatrix]